jgi:hypothetical protein
MDQVVQNRLPRPLVRRNGRVMARRAFMLALVLAPFALVACGRRGSISPPPDADPKAPRTYPTR